MPWHLGIFGLGILLLLGAPYFFRKRVDPLAEREAKLAEWERRLHGQAKLIDRKTQELGNQLAAFRAWREFPIPVAEVEEESVPMENVRDQDQQVQAILEKESREIFQKLVGDQYGGEDGKLEWNRLREDLLEVIRGVARVYRPDSKEPLMETAVEDILIFFHRLTLQLLVLVETIDVPGVKLREKNVSEVYRLVQNGTSAYRTYQSARPFLEAASYAWRGASVVMASNPLTAAAWFGGTELVKRGGSKLAQHVGKEYALGIFAGVIRVVGNETAGLYGKDFRHRDFDWALGAEIAHLMASLEKDPSALAPALECIGDLALRSEYDRIFLYRCLARRKSPKPERFAFGDLLGFDQREQLLKRLDKFQRKHLPGANPRSIDKWRLDILRRLG